MRLNQQLLIVFLFLMVSAVIGSIINGEFSFWVLWGVGMFIVFPFGAYSLKEELKK